MRKKNSEHIGEVLQQFLNENGILKQKIAEHRVIRTWNTLWGKAIASYTSNLYLRDGILYVHLNSSVLRSELLLAKELLINRLNQYAGMYIVTDIIFR
jgi:predicted nucleic acid-binding Zn ribbon protein